MPRLRGGSRDRPLTSALVDELIALGVSSGVARELVERCGVESVDDLAARDPLAMWVAHTRDSARTHRNGYDAFVRAVSLAGGMPAVVDDPLVAVWQDRHGDTTPLPFTTASRLRAPTIGVSAAVVSAVVDPAGHVTRPVGQHEVAVLADPAPRVAIGHWMWRGGLGAFARLEDLRVGDGVELKGEGWFVVTDVEMLAGEEPPALPPPGGDEVLLATPPHRRAMIIGLPEQLPPVERGVLQVRVRALAADRAATDTTPRRKRAIRGAF